ESCVAFIGVKNRGTHTESAENTEPSDPKNDLLPDSVILVASIEPRSEFSVRRRVFVDLRIHQIQREPSEIHSPDFHEDMECPHPKFDNETVALLGGSRLDGRVAP